MAQANIVTVKSTGAGYYFEVKMPSGDMLGFNAMTQAAAVGILRSLDGQKTQIANDPVVVGPVELNPAPVPPPTPDPVRDQWFADYRTERTALTLATLSADLQSRYKPEYGSLI